MSNLLLSNKTTKNFFIITISCLMFTFLIINSNKTQNITQKIKKNLLPRILTSDDDSSQKTTKICEKTSSKFSDYYKSGDKTILGIEDEITEEYDQKHIKALINIVRHYYEKKETKQSSSRILEQSQTEYMKDVFKYIYHILPLVIVLGIGILSLPGWAVCCCCVCCDCKCCVCKVPKCKTPSIVLALIFYVIAGIISFYALVEQNKIFTGIADIECAVLKFTDEVLEGEISHYPPYWAGINGIKDILTGIRSKIDQNLDTSTISNLISALGDITSYKNNFENGIKADSNTITSYYKDTIDGKVYQLDIAKMFGEYDSVNNKPTPDNSVYNFWINEYDSTANKAKEEMDSTILNFGNIINNKAQVINTLDTAKSRLDEIKTDFMSLKNLIADQIIEKADKVDKTGRIIYTIFFSLLIVLCVAIIVFMLLLCCCSGKLCTELSCCQCFCKFFLHFFWNLMGLIMFLLFMGGSLFTISGTLGDDMVNVVSYLISEDNLGASQETIILDKLKTYLNKCFNDDGDILEELGFESTYVNSFEILKESQYKIEELINQFKDKWNKFVYTEYNEELQKRINFDSDELALLELGSTTTPSSITFQSLLDNFNEKSGETKEKWDITSENGDTCKSSPITELIIYHPKKCYPTDSVTATNYNTGLSDTITKLNKIKSLIDLAKSGSNSIDTILNGENGLNNKYQAFLNSEIDKLKEFEDKIKIITDLTEQYTSENDKLFSFMNCNFVKDNVAVILYYFKSSFQNDIYEVGVYLLIAAFSMPFAISFTILLIMISNEDIKINKKTIAEERRRKSIKRNSLIPPPPQQPDIKDMNAINQNEGNNTEQRFLNNNNNIIK